MKRNFYHDVNHRPKSSLIVYDQASFEACQLQRDVDQPLSRQILNDIEYGVGGRPSLPSCWDEGEDLDNMVVDDVTDMRYSSWDRMSDVCRVRPVVAEVGKDSDSESISSTAAPADIEK